MRCPRCSFEGDLIDSTCTQCGYQRVSTSESVQSTNTPSAHTLSTLLGSQSGPLRSPSMPLRMPTGLLRSPSMPLHLQTGLLSSPSMSLRTVTGSPRLPSFTIAKSGDLIHQGRYRLVDQLVLPDNQQGQGTAWLALDTTAGSTQVVVREVLTPGGDQENTAHLVRMIAMHLSEASQHTGFAKVRDVFNEQSHYFIVLQHIEGESLASLLRRQGGALSERTVAEYGRQLCEMLTVLSRQQPPLAHGAINPETVVVSPDRSRVHLIHLPLFPPKESANVSSIASYKAPEQARSVADPASDLYSVAATMHHAVTGFDPRERIAFFYPPVRRLNPTVSQQMETILAQELRLSGPQRYARATDMQKDLMALLATKQPEIEKKSVFVPTDPLKSDILQIRQRNRRHRRVRLGIFSVACLLLLAGVLFYSYVLPSLKIVSNSPTPTPNVTATTQAMSNVLNAEWQTEAPLYQTKQLGLSDGRYVFDTYVGRPSAASINAKKQAAQALLNNNMSNALNDYQEAVTYDRTDAEAQIYYEDLQIETQKVPFVTIVLGLPLDASPAHLAISRPDLQAAYEFQYRVNTQAGNGLPGGVKLRILIGNSGLDNSDVATIAKYIANRVQLGNPEHIIAVVGWPTSGESSNANSELAAVKIPLITQTASSTTLDGISPYFFRVNPNDNAQGFAEGQYAYNVLKARNVLVLRDAGDTYSQSLANIFTTSFEQLGGKVVDHPADYFTEHTTTVEQYEQAAVHDAAKNRVDLIFLPGFDDDAVRLAHALGQMVNIYPTAFSKVKILGGDGFDTGLILGNGIGPDAQLAKNFPQDMQRLVFTSFANRTEWGSSQPVFWMNWQKLYGTYSADNPDVPLPINTAIMTSDAFGVIGYSMQWVNGSLTGASLRLALAGIGKQTTSAFHGLSGPISFGNDGNPLKKSVLLLEVTSINGANTVQLVPTSS
ncbi:MAG: ABC transporter substrate-binding protein [Ktedonobacteraceae bacterium]